MSRKIKLVLLLMFIICFSSSAFGSSLHPFTSLQYDCSYDYEF